MISTGDLKKGATMEMDGQLYWIMDWRHIKIGSRALRATPPPAARSRLRWRPAWSCRCRYSSPPARRFASKPILERTSSALASVRSPVPFAQRRRAGARTAHPGPFSPDGGEELGERPSGVGGKGIRRRADGARTSWEGHYGARACGAP